MTKALLGEGHPVMVTDRIRQSCGTDLVFTYSIYDVAPPGLQAQAPRSPILRVDAAEVTSDWLVRRLVELGPTQEMAWHSAVERRGEIFHIPMIDFVDRPAKSAFCSLNEALTAELKVTSQFLFFETGRSFHGYLPEIIPEQIWTKYLGRLLTVSESGHPPLVDTRWIGHALVRGFTALRWSHNTTRYLRMASFASVLDEFSAKPANARTAL